MIENIERQDHKLLTDKLNIIEAQHIEIDLKVINLLNIDDRICASAIGKVTDIERYHSSFELIEIC